MYEYTENLEVGYVVRLGTTAVGLFNIDHKTPGTVGTFVVCTGIDH